MTQKRRRSRPKHLRPTITKPKPVFNETRTIIGWSIMGDGVFCAPCLVPLLWYSITSQHQEAHAFLIATLCCLPLYALLMALFGRNGSFEVSGCLTLEVAILCLILIPMFVKLHARQQRLHRTHQVQVTPSIVPRR